MKAYNDNLSKIERQAVVAYITSFDLVKNKKIQKKTKRLTKTNSTTATYFYLNGGLSLPWSRALISSNKVWWEYNVREATKSWQTWQKKNHLFLIYKSNQLCDLKMTKSNRERGGLNAWDQRVRIKSDLDFCSCNDHNNFFCFFPRNI